MYVRLLTDKLLHGSWARLHTSYFFLEGRKNATRGYLSRVNNELKKTVRIYKKVHAYHVLNIYECMYVHTYVHIGFPYKFNNKIPWLSHVFSWHYIEVLISMTFDLSTLIELQMDLSPFSHSIYHSQVYFNESIVLLAVPSRGERW